MKANKKTKNEILIKAEQKYVRMTPQKVRLVAKAIKDLKPTKALDYLSFLDKRAAKALAKVIKQAMANAVKNKKIDKNSLFFKKIEIGEGAVYKRWHQVSRGRAHSILKRTSHIRIVLKVENKPEKLTDLKKNNKIKNKQPKKGVKK